MVATTNRRVNDGQYAAHLLAKKIGKYQNSNAIVVVIDPDDVPLGLAIAKELTVPFELILSRPIKHPGNPKKTIGRVSLDQVLTPGTMDNYGIPQDFLMHQILNLRSKIRKDYTFVFGDRIPPTFKNKTIIIVCNFPDNSEGLPMALKTIKSKKPFQIIIATPLRPSPVVTKIAEEVNALVSLNIEYDAPDSHDFHETQAPLSLVAVRALWRDLRYENKV